MSVLSLTYFSTIQSNHTALGKFLSYYITINLVMIRVQNQLDICQLAAGEIKENKNRSGEEVIATERSKVQGRLTEQRRQNHLPLYHGITINIHQRCLLASSISQARDSNTKEVIPQVPCNTKSHKQQSSKFASQGSTCLWHSPSGNSTNGYWIKVKD